MEKVQVFGIPSCSSVKKARAWLAEHGVAHEFHDFKKQGLSESHLDQWLRSVKEAMQNPMRRFIPNSGALLRWTSCRYLRISASKSALHGIPILGETCTQRVLQSFLNWQTLINRKGTTWRGLPKMTQNTVLDQASARAVMLAHPSLVKRPVVVAGTRIIVGVNPEAWSSVVSININERT